MILPPSFYRQEDVVLIAKSLLGKILVTKVEGVCTSGIIVETEAYEGITDRASHAFGGKQTARTEIMYENGGVAYIYLCYGLHHLFNVITNTSGVPHAVLIRAIEPLKGIDIMLKRRNKISFQPSLTNGPGVLSQALGITTKLNGNSLQGTDLFIEDSGIPLLPENIVATTRVGVAYAGKDALLPYRFYVQRNVFVSKAKGL
ncbi:MAG: DNA-3-methyladenine glycosylase [Bacteroidetes bacterium]|nr:DNA-3-methyladenine glycosylase [Bacteroidota bacterium]